MKGGFYDLTQNECEQKVYDIQQKFKEYENEQCIYDNINKQWQTKDCPLNNKIIDAAKNDNNNIDKLRNVLNNLLFFITPVTYIDTIMNKLNIHSYTVYNFNDYVIKKNVNDDNTDNEKIYKYNKNFKLCEIEKHPNLNTVTNNTINNTNYRLKIIIDEMSNIDETLKKQNLQTTAVQFKKICFLTIAIRLYRTNSLNTLQYMYNTHRNIDDAYLKLMEKFYIFDERNNPIIRDNFNIINMYTYIGLFFNLINYINSDSNHSEIIFDEMSVNAFNFMKITENISKIKIDNDDIKDKKYFNRLMTNINNNLNISRQNVYEQLKEEVDDLKNLVLKTNEQTQSNIGYYVLMCYYIDLILQRSKIMNINIYEQLACINKYINDNSEAYNLFDNDFENNLKYNLYYNELKDLSIDTIDLLNQGKFEHASVLLPISSCGETEILNICIKI